jgi:hypothetical protein
VLRRLGWQWTRLQDYPGLKAVGGVTGDLGFQLEPLAGHTVVLGRGEMGTKTIPGQPDFAGMSNVMMVFGGKYQTPPINEIGFRVSSMCVKDACTGSKRRFEVMNRLWRWEAQADRWTFGVPIVTGMLQPRPRWFHAMARNNLGFYVQGGLGIGSQNTRVYGTQDQDESLRLSDMWFYRFGDKVTGTIQGWSLLDRGTEAGFPRL